ncbi:hypothetical protein [Synechococcus sp. GEYO]|uniref:hypothetical protein n=1 Tax=Synechococcus sp. GEYO TaxID=2575511 RepID=UPI000E0FF5BE|nr:hypothetical protein [Synechococcus sp. GEYO]
MQMLVGLTNTLKCDEAKAVRIALYEASRSPKKPHEMAFRYACSASREKGHEGRSSERRWKLPKKEQLAAAKAAKELGITDSEFIRLSIIWLQLGIRRNEITSIENCRIVSKDASAHQWSRDNQGKPPNEQVANLKKALQEAQKLFDYLNEIKDEERHERKKESGSMPWSMRAQIDQEISDYESAQEQWFEDLLDDNSVEDVKFYLELSIVRNYRVDWDTASLIVADDLLDKSDPKKMKPFEQLELIKQGRKKAADQTRLELKKLKAKQVKELAEASSEWKRIHPESGRVDLEQQRRDAEAAQQVREEEMAQDQREYLNDPMLWDDDSHKYLQ